jgi:hypothetical protein
MKTTVFLPLLLMFENKHDWQTDDVLFVACPPPSPLFLLFIV